MDDKLMRELLDELLSALERLEAQNLAVLQFLKDQKKGADKLAPYLEQAEKTSSVKWMATRVRLNHLLDAAVHEAERVAEKQSEKPSEETQVKMPATEIEKNKENNDAKSNEAPAEKRGKVESRENISEPGIHESASQTGEVSSSDKSNGEKQSSQTTENAA